MARSDQPEQVIEAYEEHLITEDEALEMVDTTHVAEVKLAIEQRKGGRTSRVAGDGRDRNRDAS